MTDEQIVDIVSKELRDKTHGVTEQYLAIHQPVFKDNRLVVSRIDRVTHKESITIYFPVDGEKFYFTATVGKDDHKFWSLNTEPWHRVYFTGTSDTKTLTDLVALTKLKHTDGFSNGDLRPNGKSKYNFSRISFLPNPEPDTFENKLRHLLDFLETDKDGVKKLADIANGYISVAMDIHDANGMIGGPHIDKESVRRMSDLNLSIDFDLYLSGHPFKED